METVNELNESHSPTPTQQDVLKATADAIVVTITNVNNNNNNNNSNNSDNININNNNSTNNINNIDTQLLQLQQQQQQQQQFHNLHSTTLKENTTTASTTNFVAIPLYERRSPIICITTTTQRQQNGNNHHENYSNTSLTRSKSCLVRWRQFCLNFFTKIMGSNTPSEADRYEYYDYSELEEFETPARYRPDSLSALSRSTRFTEDEIKRIYRGFKAECPTGVVKEETFKLIYSQFFPQGGSCANPTLYAHYIFNTLDQDNTGIVSFEDFVQGLSILSRGSVEEKLRWTFQLYDINGDGYITREEMTDIVTAIYELMGRLPDELPEEEKIKVKVEQIFQKMDINRDGVVTLEEFLEACHNDEAISRSMSVFDSSF